MIWDIRTNIGERLTVNDETRKSFLMRILIRRSIVEAWCPLFGRECGDFDSRKSR